MEQKYLAHGGIKGMKWGIRRFQNKDGSLTPLGKKRYKASSKKSDKYHDDYKKAHDKKSVKEMSDAELRERNNRLNSERRYNELTKKKSIGKKAVNAFIASGTAIGGAVTAAATYKKLANKALDKVGDYAVKNKNFGDRILKIDFSNQKIAP